MRSMSRPSSSSVDRIDPVHVLVGLQHRLIRREARQLLDQCRQRQLLLALRGQVERWIASPVGTPSRAATSGTACPGGSLPRLAAPRAWPVAPPADRRERSRLPVPAARSRVQRAGRMVRRALVEERRMGSPSSRARSARDQARLADAGLAREQHHLALALPRLAPAAQQQPSSSSRPTSGVRCAPWQRLEAPFGHALAVTRHAASGSAKPLSRRSPRSSSSNRLPTRRRVAWLTLWIAGPRADLSCSTDALDRDHPLSPRRLAGSPQPTDLAAHAFARTELEGDVAEVLVKAPERRRRHRRCLHRGVRGRLLVGNPDEDCAHGPSRFWRFTSNGPCHCRLQYRAG